MIPALILAAGGSRRLGQPKQLVFAEGEPLLARSIRAALDCGCHPVFVVLGGASQQIEAAIDLSTVRVLRNSAWQEGIASAIRLGVEAVQKQAAEAEGLLILPCDQPRLTATHLQQLLTAFQQNLSEANVASTYGGVRGVPAIFGRACVQRLSQLQGDTGARSLLLDPELRTVEVPFPGGEIDIDTPADLERLV